MHKTLYLALTSLLFSTTALAGEKEVAQKVAADATEAVIKDKTSALSEINNPKGKFVKGEIYVFVLDFNGTVIANPMNPKLIGKNLMDFPDASGKPFRREIIESVQAKGTATVEYKYKNPTNNTVEDKVSYCKKAGELAVCAGYYK